MDQGTLSEILLGQKVVEVIQYCHHRERREVKWCFSLILLLLVDENQQPNGGLLQLQNGCTISA